LINHWGGWPHQAQMS